ncbi:tRNA pseudouridine(55) synthase TruB [Buchnera aphidicola]|uniref:tRNA pseudouridine synthase B n=1 Tax=Buchnera aphidicola (Cinara cf. splendens/pseudotsugae 3390) TaxID=2518980 RepID=A0A451CWV1_9GAMM|nr:tRNA pseudouridine(55) synthase TruB [Buchnera aphidicola]VFP77817.1 tRNA pseudouridine synthase B [Buchnera aphidicola (Cinara cf. splendens/pseudotsugae 3390)]
MNYQSNKDNSGILLLDKPKGISSNCTLQHVKKIFYARKAGYTGSLDPFATGILPILFGSATKFSEYLTNSIKKYHVIAKLGVITTTGDLSGAILQNRLVHVTESQISSILNSFIGKIEQVPPMFSAIKYSGVPLYKYARLGIFLPLKKREVIIYKLNFIQYIDSFLEFTVSCSKGTYIRSLAQDIGKRLKCGAHVVFLRRIQVGPYCSSQLVKLPDLYFVENKNVNQIYRFYSRSMLRTFLLPVSSIFLKYPSVKLFHEDVKNFQKKMNISLLKMYKTGLVRVITGINSIFLGIGIINEFSILIPKCILMN